MRSPDPVDRVKKYRTTIAAMPANDRTVFYGVFLYDVKRVELFPGEQRALCFNDGS